MAQNLATRIATNINEPVNQRITANDDQSKLPKVKKNKYVFFVLIIY